MCRTEIDCDLSFEWCQKSAEQDFVYAQYRLAHYYMLNPNLPVAANKTLFWFNKAAEQDYIPAIHMLGICYLNGIGDIKALKFPFSADFLKYLKAKL